MFFGQPIDLTTQSTKGITEFVDQAMNESQGVLIHSLNGKNRCCVAALIVLMQRFRWGLIKTLEFLNAKKPGLEMTASLLKKLLQFEHRLETDSTSVLTKDWETLHTEGTNYEEELLITNCYKNSLKNENPIPFLPLKPSKRKKFGVRWNKQNEVFGDGKTKKLEEMKIQQASEYDHISYDIIH